MSLRYIVPAMGLLACSAPVSAATQAGKLTIDGYVAAVLEVSDTSEDVGQQSTFEFSAQGQIAANYSLSDTVHGVAKLFKTAANDRIDLREAYIAWALNKKYNVTLTAGKFHNWFGYEADELPDLIRINRSVFAEVLGGSDAIGTSVTVRPTEELHLGAYLCNSGVLAPAGSNPKSQVAGGDDNDAVAMGADGVYKLKVGTDLLFTFNLALVYDLGTTLDSEGGKANSLGIDLNGDCQVKSIRSTFGLDFAYVDRDAYAQMGIMLFGKYDFEEKVMQMPASVTLMLDYVDPCDDDDLVENDELFEIAAAFMATPVEHLGAEVEVRYISKDTKAYPEGDEFGLFLGLLAVF